MVHGAAGSCAYGLQNNLWSPAATGRAFDLSPTSLAPLEPLRDYMTIVSNTDVPHGGGVHDAGDRRRSFPRELRVPHPGASQADDGIGPARRDVVRPDLRARVRSGHGDSVDAALRSRTSTIQAGASTTTRAPTPTRSAGRRRASRCRCCATRAPSSTRCSAPAPRLRNARKRRREDRSILDTIVASIDRLKTQLGATDRARLSEYLDDVREIERRIQNIERSTAAASTASCRTRRWACPIRSTSTSS